MKMTCPACGTRYFSQNPHSGQTFHQEVEAMPWAKPDLPVLPVPEAGSVTRTTPLGQATTEGAVKVPLLQALTAGFFVPVLGYGILFGLERWDMWRWPLVGFLVVTPVIAWGDFIYHNGLLMLKEKIESWVTPEAEEAEVKRIEIDVTIYEPKERGGGKVGFVRLFSPESNQRGLFQYARSFLAGRAFFSYAGGETGDGAKEFGYTQREFRELFRNAKKAELITQGGKRQQWIPTPIRGKFVFGRIADKQLEQELVGTPLPR